MLQDALYTVEGSNREINGKRITALIRLNPDHAIFSGHYPGNPVLPGVCIIQILKELLVRHSGGPMVLKILESVKYYSVINPELNTLLRFDIQLGEMACEGTSFKASIYFESVVYCRVRGSFTVTAPC